MNNLKPRDDLAHSEKSAEFEGNIRDLTRSQSGAFRRSVDNTSEPASLIRKFSFESTREIDRLIDDLKNLRRKLEDDGNRVQRDVADYTALSQSVVQLTQIVSDSMTHVKTFSDTPAAVTLVAEKDHLAAPRA
jgi:hypothetical protein